MRKLLVWIAVTVGIAALVRRLRRRRDASDVDVDSPTEGPAFSEPSGDDPADELRRKLAESRDDEPTADEAVEGRRADVHAEGRAALDEMQRSSED